MLTGLIFGGIVVAWVAYLVPWAAAKRDGGWIGSDAQALDAFGSSMRIVSSCHNTDDLPDSGAPVSTPLTRQAGRFNVRRANQIAQRRRRIGMAINLVLLVVTVVLPFVAPVSHWLALGGAGLFATWIGLSAYSVRTMAKASAERREQIAGCNDEATVAIRVSVDGSSPEKRSIELTDQLDTIKSLLEPLSVTPSTYVSKPLLPRSVRTIDLSAPLPPQHPVTAERPDAPAQDPIIDLPKAVGE